MQVESRGAAERIGEVWYRDVRICKGSVSQRRERQRRCQAFYCMATLCKWLRKVRCGKPVFGKGIASY